MSLLDEALEDISPPSRDAAEAMKARLDDLTKPRGSLGRLEGLAVTVASVLGLEADRQKLLARVPFKKRICVAVGDHGVVSEGVSAYPQEVTGQMILNFLAGGAAINALAARAGADVEVIDCGTAHPPEAEGYVKASVAPGTANIAEGPAMTREQAVVAIEIGIEAASRAKAAGVEFLGAGDMGIGNTTSSAAMIAAVTGASAKELAGRGAGLDDKGLKAKVEVLVRVLESSDVDPHDGLDLLAKLGGFEIGCIAGLCIGGAAEGMVVFVDGVISSAGALVAWLLAPDCHGHMVWSHRSVEPAHAAMFAHLGVDPLVDLGFRLGEGTGAAVAMMLADTAVEVAARMATFGEAGVSDG